MNIYIRVTEKFLLKLDEGLITLLINNISAQRKKLLLEVEFDSYSSNWERIIYRFDSLKKRRRVTKCKEIMADPTTTSGLFTLRLR